MAEAYVLIQTAPGAIGSGVSKAVARIKGVVSTDDVSGPYDVIARAQAQSLDDLARAVIVTIQKIDGVTRTLTCPIVRLD